MLRTLTPQLLDCLLHLKFYRSILAHRCATIRSFACWALWCIPNSCGCCHCTNSLHLVFYGIVLACRCATAWSLACWAHLRILVGHPNSCGHCNLTTAGLITTITSSTEPHWAIDHRCAIAWLFAHRVCLGIHIGHSNSYRCSRPATAICSISSFTCFVFSKQWDRWGTCKVGLLVV